MPKSPFGTREAFHNIPLAFMAFCLVFIVLSLPQQANAQNLPTGGAVLEGLVNGQRVRIHEFTSIGTSTFTVPADSAIRDTSGNFTTDALIVGGGGAGGRDGGAGGGGGGVTDITNWSFSTSDMSITVTVGGGDSPNGGSGGTSRVSNGTTTYSATGGSGGQSYTGGTPSGGAAGYGSVWVNEVRTVASQYSGWGGNGPTDIGGARSFGSNGGTGHSNSFEARYNRPVSSYGGGGGGGVYGCDNNTSSPSGGSFGGGRGAYNYCPSGASTGYSGTTNSGGGGGGGSADAVDAARRTNGGAGGSGLVLIGYSVPFPVPTISSTSSSPVTGSFTANINFNLPVANFDISDIVVSNASLSNFSGSGSSYSVDVEPLASGAVTLDIDADVANDSIANSVTHEAASQFSITADLRPVVQSISYQSADGRSTHAYRQSQPWYICSRQSLFPQQEQPKRLGLAV